MLKMFSIVMVLAAIIVGGMAIFGVIEPHSQMDQIIVHIVLFREFFDVALPILGFAALVKYLCSCRCACGCCK